MTTDGHQVRAPMFAPQHARATVLTVFCSSLRQNLLEDGLHGPCHPSGATDRMGQCSGDVESADSSASARVMRWVRWL